MRDPCSQLVGFFLGGVVIRSSLFIPLAPVHTLHTLDIKSSSGTSVFVSLLLLSFFVAALLTNERPVVRAFENDLCAEFLASEATSLPYSLNLSLYLHIISPHQYLRIKQYACNGHLVDGLGGNSSSNGREIEADFQSR